MPIFCYQREYIIFPIKYCFVYHFPFIPHYNTWDCVSEKEEKKLFKKSIYINSRTKILNFFQEDNILHHMNHILCVMINGNIYGAHIHFIRSIWIEYNRSQLQYSTLNLKHIQFGEFVNLAIWGNISYTNNNQELNGKLLDKGSFFLLISSFVALPLERVLFLHEII